MSKFTCDALAEPRTSDTVGCVTLLKASVSLKRLLWFRDPPWLAMIIGSSRFRYRTSFGWELLPLQLPCTTQGAMHQSNMRCFIVTCSTWTFLSARRHCTVQPVRQETNVPGPVCTHNNQRHRHRSKQLCLTCTRSRHPSLGSPVACSWPVRPELDQSCLHADTACFNSNQARHRHSDRWYDKT